MSQFKDLLTDENAKKVAEDVVAAFELATKDDLDIDYHLNNGVMQRNPISSAEVKKAIIELHGKEVPSPNTSFSFNTKRNTILWYINDTVCKAMDEDRMTESDFESMQDFLKKVIKEVNSETLIEKMKTVLRKTVLNNADERMFHLKDTCLVLFEFGSKEDYGDIISIQNHQRYNKITKQFVGEKKAIAQDILKRRREFGFDSDKTTREIYDTIVTEQKASGNDLYEFILPEDIKIVKEAKECHIDIFSDYSPISKEEYKAIAESLGLVVEPTA